MSTVILRRIENCTSDQQKAVRDVRNQPSIRSSMYTEHEIGLNEHLAWLEKLKTDDSQIVFIVLVDDTVSGVVSVNAIDQLHQKSDWAFYLDENVRGGLGAALECALLDFVFNTLSIEKLNCEVIETNQAVVKMHKKFGFIEEGLRRENIQKNGKRIGVYFLGITKAEWLQNRASILDKYSAILSKFDLSIEY